MARRVSKLTVSALAAARGLTRLLLPWAGKYLFMSRKIAAFFRRLTANVTAAFGTVLAQKNPQVMT